MDFLHRAAKSPYLKKKSVYQKRSDIKPTKLAYRKQAEM